MFDVVKGDKTGIHMKVVLRRKKFRTFTSRLRNIYPKTLGRILSFYEYNFSPLGIPVGNLEHHFLTTHARLTTSDKTWELG
jgi:hypothetical protein